VLGQLHETVGPRDGEDPVQHYIQVLADKTGSLIAAAAQAGIAFSDAPDAYEGPVIAFGEKIGVAFQLIDDVIDLSPQPEETGKVPGTDLRAGVATLPLLRLRDLATTDASAASLLARLDTEVRALPAAGTLDDGADAARPLTAAESASADAAIAALREHRVTADTLAEAHRWARDAVEAIEPLPAGAVKKALTRFAETIVERSK
jgi:heptaprenyl diphosphate synthase